LTVEFWNANDTALLFPLEEGLEVLYYQTGFGVNFACGLGIVFLWLGLLASLGLAAASYLSFPVAAFVSLSMLIIALFSGTLANVVREGSVTGPDHEGRREPLTLKDYVLVPTFAVMLKVLNLVEGFSPIDSLSTGRSITWWQLGRAFAQIGLLVSGTLAVVGITLFTRRELALAQSQV